MSPVSARSMDPLAYWVMNPFTCGLEAWFAENPKKTCGLMLLEFGTDQLMIMCSSTLQMHLHCLEVEMQFSLLHVTRKRKMRSFFKSWE